MNRVRTAAALALAVVALAACGTGQAGSASVVGASSVRDADVAAAVTELRGQLAGVAGAAGAPAFDIAAVTSRNVERLTRHLLLDAAARAKGIAVSQGDVDEIVASTVTAQFGGDRTKFDLALAGQESVPASAVVDYARDFLLQRSLRQKLAPGGTDEAQGKAVTDYLATLSSSLGVTVAPRFGTWDVGSGALGPVPNDLSRPAAAVTSSSPRPVAS